MSFENPLWGAPKIHGELLKLGIEVAQSTVSIYMVPRQDRPLLRALAVQAPGNIELMKRRRAVHASGTL